MAIAHENNAQLYEHSGLTLMHEFCLSIATYIATYIIYTTGVVYTYACSRISCLAP